MLKPSLLTAGILALTAVSPAQAAPMPSMVHHAKAKKPWTVTIVKDSIWNNGKCKIYANKPPEYDDDDNITSQYAAELKKDGSSYTFEPKKDYWLVVYPHLGLVNVELKFTREGEKPEKAVTLTIKELNVLGQTSDAAIHLINGNPNQFTFVQQNYLQGLEQLGGAEAVKAKQAGKSSYKSFIALE